MASLISVSNSAKEFTLIVSKCNSLRTELSSIFLMFSTKVVGRVDENKSKLIDGFSKKYNIIKLVYCKILDAPNSGIHREKKLKEALKNHDRHFYSITR